MTGSWQPEPDDLAHLFAPLAPFRHALLAVSGGSDSVALLNLAVRWKATPAGRSTTLAVATVDHGLRPQSHAEALQVGVMARGLGLPHHVLTWDGPKPERAIQEEARKARYRLLARQALASADGPAAIVTAHTRDDQGETVLMRLARGSGPDGLAGMAPVRPLADGAAVSLVRPLLSVTRDDLRTWLVAQDIAWLDDPSNEDRRFERVRLRTASAILRDLGLTPAMLSLAAARQRRAVAALDEATDALQAVAVDLHDGAFASIALQAYRAAPEEIRVRILRRALAMFGGAAPRAALAEVERLAGALARTASASATLGGCEVRASASRILVYRETGRGVLPEAVVEPGQTITWDGRFRIARAPGPAGPCVKVRALEPGVYAELRKRATSRPLIPARAAATLPAVWSGDRLVAIGGVSPALLDAPEVDSGQSVAVETRFLFADAHWSSCVV